MADFFVKLAGVSGCLAVGLGAYGKVARKKTVRLGSG